MRRIIFPLLLGVSFLIFQTTWLTLPFVHRIRPDLVMILTLCLGLSYPPVSGGMIAFFLGYSMDLFSGNGFGLFTFSRVLLFYGAQFSRDRIYLESSLSQSLFVFLSALSESLIMMLLLKALNPVHLRGLYPLFLAFFLPQALGTALIAPVVFHLFRKGASFLFAHSMVEAGKKG